MRTRALGLVLVALSAAVGCARSSVGEAEAEKPELSATDRALVLDAMPSDIPNPLSIDFNGKAELVGYALEPRNVAAPGSKLTLKLYWRSTGNLGPGYGIFTELVTPDGRRFDVQGGGPVRQGALAPPNWELGKVYVDEQEIVVPADIDASRLSIVVGLKTEPSAPEQPSVEAGKESEKAEEKAAGNFDSVYLSVLSGQSDDKHGGVVATLETGVTPGAQRARAAKGDKRGAGAIKRAPNAGGLPASAKPRPAPAQ